MLIGRPDAVEVIPGLMVGSRPSRLQIRRLVAGGVTVVVDLRTDTEGVEVRWPETIIRAQFQLQDHAAPAVEALEEAGRMVADFIRQGEVVLVHCHAGLERAPTVACATLLCMGWSLGDAYRRVLERRRDAAPTGGQLAALGELATQLGPQNLSGSRRVTTPILF